ncbi:hypothetical protein [Cryobacterium sp. M91]|uniref:hypothetical protein n=1 Tax=Cryobacterium sp. M91 TaxID=2048294 RepID=UPI0011B00595|nr:hypothetical protein [Cryobacterium sp. M91]
MPPVELALLFKAYAAQSRHAPQDITDLYNLLSIAFEYPVDQIGGWKIGTPPVSRTRLDAARTLHALADSTPLEPCMPWRTRHARAMSWPTRAYQRTD